MSVKSRDKANRRAAHARHLFAGGPPVERPKSKRRKTPKGTKSKPPAPPPPRSLEARRSTKHERRLRELDRRDRGLDARGKEA